MFKRILKHVGIAVLCLLVVGIASALAYRVYEQQSLASARALAIPPGIDSLDRVRVGGIDQWIHVRGRDTNNPILLFIHGGPNPGSRMRAPSRSGTLDKSARSFHNATIAETK